MDKKYEYLAFLLVFAIGLYLWSLPIDSVPFGDVDASTHYVIGDYMASTDKPMLKLPYFLKQYESVNYGNIWYAPQFHTNEAVVSSLSGDPVISVYLYNAFACSLIFLSIFLLIRLSFGFFPAIVSSFMVVFSIRDYMFYLFGLWPQTLSFAFTPFVLYLFYSYYNSENRSYLYIMALVLAVQSMFHLQGFIYSVAVILVYAALSYLLSKKIKIEIKPLLLSVVLFLVLAVPFIVMIWQITAGELSGGESFKVQNIGRLFAWYPDPQTFVGAVPPGFFIYKDMYGYWTLPFLFAGLVFLILRFRKQSSILMFSWLFVYYAFMHLDIIGKGGRMARFIGIEAHLFYPLMALGVFFLLSMVKSVLPKDIERFAKPAVALAFILIFAFANVPNTYATLRDAYKGPLRLSQSQYKACLDIRGLVQDKDILVVGSTVSAKTKFLRALSYNYVTSVKSIIPNGTEGSQYIWIDYNDFAVMGQKDAVQALQAYEASLSDFSSIYTSDDKMTRLYRLR